MATVALVAQDTATQGSWVGVYGADGYYIVSDGNSYPAYASVTVGTWSGPFGTTSTDVRALQKASNHSVRTAALSFSSAGSTIDITITGGPKQVAIYMWAGDANVSQVLQVLDMDNGGALLCGGIPVTNYFTTPLWLVFNVSGHVQFKFIPNAGTNSCRFNGFFFDAAGTPIAAGGAATYLSTDSSTQGNWVGVYGANGYNVVTDDLFTNPPVYPSYATVTPSGEAEFTFDPASTDVRALQLPSNHSNRFNAVWFGDLTIDLVLTGGLHKFAIYFFDGSNGGRAETVTIMDGATFAVYDTRSLSSFYLTPVYLSWTCSGHIAIQLTKTAGANAVVSGLFFDGGAVAIKRRPVCFIIT